MFGELAARRQLDAQFIDDCLADIVLDREYIRHLAVVALRPEMVTGGDIDQLGRYPDACPGFAHASLEDVLHVEFRADLPDVQVFGAQGEGRGAGRDLQAGQLREGVDDLFCQPVTEILVFFVGAEIGYGWDL